MRSFSTSNNYSSSFSSFIIRIKAVKLFAEENLDLSRALTSHNHRSSHNRPANGSNEVRNLWNAAQALQTYLQTLAFTES